MKLREHLAGNRKPEAKAHWTANVARYTMRPGEDTKGTPEELREAVARSSGLSSQESRA
jgi:hypothetical protein